MNFEGYFGVLADAASKTAATQVEDEVILTIIGALRSCCFHNTRVSLYDPVRRSITSHIGHGSFADSSESIAIDAEDIHATALRSGKVLTASIAHTGTENLGISSRASKGTFQIVIPLRLESELIGTLEVVIDEKPTDPSVETVLRGFAALLALALSRIRTGRAAADLTTTVLSGARFYTAAELLGSAVHSFGHSVDHAFFLLNRNIEKGGVRERRDLLEPLLECRNLIADIRDKLRNSLAILHPSISESLTADAHDAIRSTLAMWEHYLASTRCVSSVSFEATHPHCRIPSHSLREILSVLIVNSIEAKSRHIHIVTSNVNDAQFSSGNYISTALRIEFQDDGIGLRTDDPEEIFSARYSTKPDRLGAGLGLFVARSLVWRAGGELLVNSSRQHSTGATFTLILPATEPAARESALSDANS